MSVLTPSNALPGIPFPQHSSGKTNTVQSYLYPGAVQVKSTGPTVLSFTNALPGKQSTGLARTFNGTSDFINCGNASNLQLAAGVANSIAGWVMVTGSPVGFGSNFGWVITRDDSTLGRNFALYLAPVFGDVYSLDVITDSTISINGSIRVSANQWQHLCVTCDTSGNLLSYINGVQDGSAAATIVASTANVWIGRDSANASTVPGRVADVAFWNTKLTATQISKLAQGNAANTIGANANLLLYLPMTGASPEPDQSGNGNNGTLTGTGTTAGPPLGDRLAFPQHSSGKSSVQSFLYPGAVQPAFVPVPPAVSAAILVGGGYDHIQQNVVAVGY